jgi:hypothetical protein
MHFDILTSYEYDSNDGFVKFIVILEQLSQFHSINKYSYGLNKNYLIFYDLKYKKVFSVFVKTETDYLK